MWEELLPVAIRAAASLLRKASAQSRNAVVLTKGLSDVRTKEGKKKQYKCWGSSASVIRCGSAATTTARFWPGARSRSVACQNTIPLAWHLKSAFYALAPRIQNVKSPVVVVISLSPANWPPCLVSSAALLGASCAALVFAATSLFQRHGCCCNGQWQVCVEPLSVSQTAGWSRGWRLCLVS